MMTALRFVCTDIPRQVQLLMPVSGLQTWRASLCI
jgi:hypothetical protein